MNFKVVFIVVMIELLFVGWIDFKTKKISNYWVILNVILSIGLYMMASDVYHLSLNILIFPLGFIVAGFILFLLNIMGAGDSKFLASLFLLTPSEYQIILFEKILLSTIVTGALLLSFSFVRNRKVLIAFMTNRHWRGIRDIIKSRFSYAPVISVAWLLLGRDLWK
jgi:prepilin peptidase CpaA